MLGGPGRSERSGDSGGSRPRRGYGSAMATAPRPEQFTRLVQSDLDGPVVMVNVLRFKERAEGEDGSGAEAYGRYGEVARRTVEAVGGRILWSGRVDSLVIGDDEADRYDMVALVEYPSRKAFADMVARSDYQEGHQHRESGLEAQLLIATTSLAGELLA